MNTFTLVIACFLVAGVKCGGVFTYGVPAAVPVVHQPLVYQTVVRANVVTEYKELADVPHHDYGYAVEKSKVLKPKSAVVHQDSLVGLPYRPTDYHPAPVLTVSRTYVLRSRPHYVAERGNNYVL